MDTGARADTGPICTPLTCTHRIDGDIEIVDGSPWATYYSEDYQDGLGIDANHVGDIDGDGRSDPMVVSLRETSENPNWGITGTFYVIPGAEAGLHVIGTKAVTIYFEEDPWDPSDGVLQQGSLYEAGRTAGDLDGDGLGDLLFFGDDYQDDGFDYASRGAIWVVNGPIGVPGGRLNLATEATTTIGPDWYAFGEDAIGGADLTGDGQPDLIGAASGILGEQSGRVDIFPGPVPEGLVAQAELSSATIWESPGQWYALANCELDVGDFTGDGLGDVVIGAENWDHGGELGTGGLFVFSGPVPTDRDLADAHFYRHGLDYHDFLGRHTALQYDLDGDGLRDIAAGVDSDDDDDEGIVFVYAGGQEGDAPMEEATATLVGDEANDLSHEVGHLGGDLDGDGMGDLVVGSWGVGPGDEEHGAYVLYGPIPPGAAVTSELAAAIVTCGYEACTQVGTAGDVDGDGWEDLFLGSKWNNFGETDSGALHVLRGGLE